MLEKVQNLRKQFLIEPKLQSKIIVNFCILGFIMILINFASIYILINRIIARAENASRMSPELYDMMTDTWVYLAISSSVLSLVIIVLFGFYGLFFSNRIAGPIYNLRSAIRKNLQDDAPIQVQFRKDDYFQELSEEMNQLATKYAQRK